MFLFFRELQIEAVYWFTLYSVVASCCKELRMCFERHLAIGECFGLCPLSWDFTSVVHMFFVHDEIYNSVADYNSSRVGVGCGMYVKCPFHFHDGITGFLGLEDDAPPTAHHNLSPSPPPPLQLTPDMKFGRNTPLGIGEYFWYYRGGFLKLQLQAEIWGKN